METNIEAGKLKVVPEFSTTGNSPFLGSVYATLKNSSNQTVTEQQQTVALYFSGKRSVELSLPENLPSGDYEVELRYETSGRTFLLQTWYRRHRLPKRFR